MRKKIWLACIIMCVSMCLGIIMGKIYKTKFPNTLDSIIQEEARHFSIDSVLLKSIIQAESSGKQNVISSKGAQGLMQIMPATAKELAHELKIDLDKENIFTPHINIRLGAYYISKLLKRFQGDVIAVLASYNTGPTRVARWLRENPGNSTEDIIQNKASKETNQYIQRVMRNYKQNLENSKE
ncbi:MAG: lytic transglycosylase domain-containing protein [Planctomycetes bacterium]|nr:lytic transglycosylase domain-containing protein [Planctomycetota bacterium]HPY75660.1 lytic transglycosylase domain-containing protein [Planctomycetota bacterium]HQB00133.1 lytic transglycosylase domain-containing protein [Planctomycetota bacterium]